MARAHGDDELPAHTVRVSERARRVRLVMSPREGLVVVVPRGHPLSDVPRVLQRHRVWIDRAHERVAERLDRAASAADTPIPASIEMPGIGVSWEVALAPGMGPSVRSTVRDGRLVLSGATHDLPAAREAIRRAVSRVARERLPLLLGGFESETGWRSSGVTVRRQRTRWGSCSSAGAISLNQSLIFLPPRLVRFVMVHELAHTERMDHSPRFWALVERHEAGWRACRRELRQAWRHVPVWAEP